MRQQRAATGSNCITTAWEGTGLQPYTREAPFWMAAIGKFGQRDELAKVPAGEILLPTLVTEPEAAAATPRGIQ